MVVDDREVGGQQQGQLGHAELVGRVRGQRRLPVPHDVPAERADQAAGQRRQPGDRGGAQRVERAARARRAASPSVGTPDGHVADPDGATRRARSGSRASARRRTSTGPSVPSASADSRMNVPGRPAASVRYRPTGVTSSASSRRDHGDDPAVAGQARGTPRATATCHPRGPPPRRRAVGTRAAAAAVMPGLRSRWAGADDRGQRAAGVEAGARARVAGGTDLVDLDQQGVAVAVEAHGLDVLGVAGRVALAPVLLARAAPEHDAAGGQRAAQRLVVHPAEHEHLARCRAAARSPRRGRGRRA